MANLTAIILGGGRGSRLEPLTRMRAKPAVPIGGKFRLIDIPISNCIHSGIKGIFILTQFNTESLHRHIHNTYRFDNFTRGYVRILAAQQTASNQNWYQGTADAVRQNLEFFEDADDNVIILSGDHLYRMDYREFFNYHLKKKADITIAAKPIMGSEARGFGILKAGDDGRISEFYEKPEDDSILENFKVNRTLFNRFNIDHGQRDHIASMGIYIFKKKILFDMLKNNEMEDFGREIIPLSLKKARVFAFFYDDYWKDIGSIRSFFDAHMDLTMSMPEFNFYDEQHLFFTRPRYLPSTKFIDCRVNHSIVSEGAILLGSTIENASVGIRSFIDEGTHIERAIVMGNTRYETNAEKQDNWAKGVPNLGIGKNCVIRNSIIDMDVAIGANVKLINQEGVTEAFRDNYAIREGITIIPKGAVVPDNTVI
ncbi:MAG: glucose-1-phosphate adenylyltransferase [Calditrichales bacterium]|nr:MAG: glucose-1-phosphate adenylyltransferase [Calditrichales bacterium]